jgi:hypothetical protein
MLNDCVTLAWMLSISISEMEKFISWVVLRSFTILVRIRMAEPRMKLIDIKIVRSVINLNTSDKNLMDSNND